MLRIIPKNEGQLSFLKSMEEMPEVIYDPHKRKIGTFNRCERSKIEHFAFRLTSGGE